MSFDEMNIRNTWGEAKSDLTQWINLSHERAYVRMYNIKNWSEGIPIVINDFDIDRDIIAVKSEFKNRGSSYTEYNTYYVYLHKEKMSDIVNTNHGEPYESYEYTVTLTPNDDGGYMITRSDIFLDTFDVTIFLIRTDGIYNVDGTTGEIITEEG